MCSTTHYGKQLSAKEHPLDNIVIEEEFRFFYQSLSPGARDRLVHELKERVKEEKYRLLPVSSTQMFVDVCQPDRAWALAALKNEKDSFLSVEQALDNRIKVTRQASDVLPALWYPMQLRTIGLQNLFQ